MICQVMHAMLSSCLKLLLCFCRLIMQAFILALDLRYDELFCCNMCMQDGAALVLDAKAMGVKRSTFRLSVPPVAEEAPAVAVTWSVS